MDRADTMGKLFGIMVPNAKRLQAVRRHLLVEPNGRKLWRLNDRYALMLTSSPAPARRAM